MPAGRDASVREPAGLQRERNKWEPYSRSQTRPVFANKPDATNERFRLQSKKKIKEFRLVG